MHSAHFSLRSLATGNRSRPVQQRPDNAAVEEALSACYASTSDPTRSVQLTKRLSMLAHYICGRAFMACNSRKFASSDNREWSHPCTIAAHHITCSRPPDLACTCHEYLRQAVKELLTACLICADRFTAAKHTIDFGMEGFHLKKQQGSALRYRHAEATSTCSQKHTAARTPLIERLSMLPATHGNTCRT